MTGSPGESGGVDGAGVYFSLSSGRDGLQGLNAIYYGVKDGKAVKIWPGEGMYRITALVLNLADNLSSLLHQYAVSTNDFKVGNGSLKVSINGRTWTRNQKRSDIRWDSNANTLYFENNSGPFADFLKRGDYLNIDARMEAWGKTLVLTEDSTSEFVKVSDFNPVTTCDIYIGADWKGDIANAAAICKQDGTIAAKAEAQMASSKKKKKGGSKKYGQEKTVQGISYPGYIVLRGVADSKVLQSRISYPAACQSITARVMEIQVKE